MNDSFIHSFISSHTCGLILFPGTHFFIRSHIGHGEHGENVESIAAGVQGWECVKGSYRGGNEAQHNTSGLGSEPGFGLDRVRDVENSRDSHDILKSYQGQWVQPGPMGHDGGRGGLPDPLPRHHAI